ncbi:hypothetical protein ACFQT0_05785 [Hymenobacter humi]|uniref:Uncharacterized protein n=1 Tax=Hymenobacter humi TaxID=1411620 RepID=A0ABW2U0H6_9BACT
MSANPIEDNSTPKPTGSLEDLFRHHLGEEAAVPPRPMLWDQIDNSLLIRQNETYRRRLAATRWVAAASLLLATLAGTGWWAHRASDMAGAEVATRTVEPHTAASTSTGAAATAGNGRYNGNGQADQTAASVAANSSSTARNSAAIAASGITPTTSGSVARATYPSAQSAVGANSARRETGFGPGEVRNELENGVATTTRSAGQRTAGAAAGSTDANPTGASSTETVTSQNQSAIAARTSQPTSSEAQGLSAAADRTDSSILVAAGTTTTAATTAAAAATTTGAVSGAAAGAPTMAAFSQASTVAAAEPVSMLATSPASLAVSVPAALPNGLATLSLPENAETAVASEARKWHFGGSYAAGAFNPNINFSRVGIEPEHDYNPALGTDSPALTEAAAAQYRENLRPGLGQRIALQAKRHLTGHWSLTTGAEFSQSSAKSASASAFVGEQPAGPGPV